VPARWAFAGPERRLLQIGKPGKYEFAEGTPEQHKLTVETIQESCRHTYAAYQEMLEAGVAREVARTMLPLSLLPITHAAFEANGRVAP
jgi:thymidylate synthase (FAD)